VARPESLDALVGLDRVLGLLERAATAAPRPYHFVILSDHGQSQGRTFRQRHGGRGLEDVLRELLANRAQVVGATGPVEQWGPANALLGHQAEADGVSSKVVRGVLDRRARRGPVAVGPNEVDQALVAPERDSARPDLVVIGSGNLGGVWVANRPGRVTLESVEAAYPGLVGDLVRTDGIGFVVLATEAGGPVAVGRGGRHWLAEGRVEGDDPLAPFGPRAAGDFLRASTFVNAPDLYVHSSLDPATDDVAAFEELVGCHGGLGGWQSQAVLVHPADWDVPDELLEGGELHGAERLHQVLVRWLEECGQRRDLRIAAAPGPVEPPPLATPGA
jgi:hypothetical protein